MSESKPYLSVVVPLYNEEGNVTEVHRRIVEALRRIGRPFEVIFIDDGSRDRTFEETHGLSPLTVIRFRKNFGQTAAFDAGIKASHGDIIVTLDGDLQNDPADIPLLLAEMDKGFDVVAGWRVHRQDSLMKRFFSRGANFLRSILVRDGIHDSGCSLKAYRRECFREVDLFGEMHRFMPALLALDGFRVSEVPVSHFPRVHGATKYSWNRAIKGFVDMIAIWFWRKYSHRPIHLFGGSGIVLMFLGSVILTWMLIAKFFYGAHLADRLWPLIGVFFLLIGVQLFIYGLLADVIVRNYYHMRGRMNYTIRDVREQ